ncbi:mitotic checkpoint serine/threonine-protein kinase BUB1 beta [Tiliqua scincoides]|uniref:mitotic checkpoint serine/threonine-protein kinase BUB1 beta n=1 Tax=Tiliqua scincoides TaxID=71010 RepID=UPI003462951A
MSFDGNEWELSKENVQPLRQGRVMSTLQEALAQQDVSSHTAIQQQKREFESEIRFYCGSDPLDVWDRYIKWTEQTFPQGGKDSNLSAVLERAVKALNEQQRYYQDARYLSLWLKFGNCCSEPLDLYSYLHSQKIGTSLAQLYITWAEELEARGNYKKADLIFQDGLLCKAEPLDKLLSHHRQFQARVSRQALQDLEEDSDVEEDLGLSASEPQRTTLAELKGRGKKTVRAPISRVGKAVKLPNQGQRLSNPAPRQASDRPNFTVFDENKVRTSRVELPALVPQPWAAPPTIKAKENELGAGPWNTGSKPVLSNAVTSAVASAVVPSFTPYVEESAQQNTMTPCKIEPSINCVLSARKPGKEEDPLHRVQSHQQDCQEKKEQPMYCKEKVYAGVDEFSLEEIRAVIYRKKAKEEELQAIAQEKAELQRKIEKIEKTKREKQANQEQRSRAQLSQPTELDLVPAFSDAAEVPKLRVTQRQLSLTDTMASAEGPLSDGFFLGSNFELDENVQQKKSVCSDSEIPAAMKPSTPFSIFDESVALENESVSFPTGPPLIRGRRPLGVHKPSESSVAKENIPPEHSDDLHGVEPLSWFKDAIVTGSYKNKTLCPSPEDTCDFVRAAHMMSTPFHGMMEQKSQLDCKPHEECTESKTTSLSQQTIENETQYATALCVKKLSPIMEASQEDTASSTSSGSPSQICTKKFQQIPEELVLAQSCTDEIPSDIESVLDSSPEGLWNTVQRRQLLSPLPDLLTQSPDFKLEAQPMPWVELEKEVNLGDDTYRITCEYLISEDNKIFSAVPADFALEDSKAFLITVHSEPVPWDFYITLQIRERLDAAFDQSFSENCTCFLYHNGCVTLHKEINCFTLQDLIQQCKVIPQEVIVLTVDNLLDIVAKLHKAEIVHGNLHPGALFLGDRICNSFAIAEMTSALKMVDFSHSLDLTLQTRVNALKSFPVAQTQNGQLLLDEKSLPHQVDLIGIANTVHLMLCGEHMQVHQEEGCWKIDRDLSQSVDSEMWSKFFERILNSSGQSSVTLLRELREELSGAFDSTFPDRLCDSLTKLEDLFNRKNIF